MPGFAQSEVAPLSKVLIKHARDAFVDESTVTAQWKSLGYTDRPDYQKSVQEYEDFASLLEQLGAEICFLPRDDSVNLDSMYSRDTSLICSKGAILCNLGKAARQKEPPAHAAFFKANDIPIAGIIEGEGRIEGGDVVWLDERTIVVGRGYRTNDEGISQLAHILADCIDEMIVVPLPHWQGPGDVFHLMSMLSPLDTDLSLVYSPLLPIPFREALIDRNIQLVEVPEDEFESLGCNVLAVGPRKCVSVQGNPKTRDRMKDAGVEVHEFIGEEICLKGCGGPTCLTRTITRDVDGTI